MLTAPFFINDLFGYGVLSGAVFTAMRTARVYLEAAQGVYDCTPQWREDEGARVNAIYQCSD